MAKKGIIVPRRDGLVGEWLLNGNALDTAGTNNGTATNVTYTNTDRGFQKQCGVFNGSNAYVSAGDINFGTGAITVCAWIYRTGAINDYSGIASKGTGSNISNEFSLQFGGAGTSGINKIAFEIGDGTATTSYLQDTSTTINTNTWYFICGAFNPGSYQKIYINGVEVATTSSTKAAMLNGTSPLEIGRQYQIAGRNMNGNIQSVRVFNRALPKDEIQNWYLEGLRKLGGGSMSGLFDGIVGHMNSLDGTEFSDIFRGITATRTAGTATTDNLGFTRAITNPNYSYTSITYTNVYSFENSGSGWGIVSNPSGVSATACNRTTVLRELFFYNRALSTAEQTAISDLCKLNYVNWFDGPNRISIPENLKASCKLFLEGTVSGTTAFDSSGNSNNGTLVNSPTTQRSQGYKGFVFNGTNQNIDIPSSSLNTLLCGRNPWTVAFTINTTALTGGIIDTRVTDYNGLYFQMSSGRIVQVTRSDGSVADDCALPYALISGKNTMIIATYDGSTLKISSDTGAPTSKASTRTLNTSNTVVLGCGYVASLRQFYLAGNIYNLAIFDKELSDTEKKQLYYSFFIP